LFTGFSDDFNHGLVLGIGASTKILLSKIFVFDDVIAVADFDSDTAAPVTLTKAVDGDAVSSVFVPVPADSRPTSGPQDFDRTGDSAV